VGPRRTSRDSAHADLAVAEEFHGYPGLQLMAALRDAPTRNRLTAQGYFAVLLSR